MIVILLAAGFLAGFAKRSWYAVLGAALLPGVLFLLGAFDDGEGVATIMLASALSAATVGIGAIAHFCVQNLSRRALAA